MPCGWSDHEHEYPSQWKAIESIAEKLDLHRETLRVWVRRAEVDDARSRVRVTLAEKASLLARVRRDISYKATMDVWLYVHVPATFMLLAALLAHVLAIFLMW